MALSQHRHYTCLYCFNVWNAHKTCTSKVRNAIVVKHRLYVPSSSLHRVFREFTLHPYLPAVPPQHKRAAKVRWGRQSVSQSVSSSKPEGGRGDSRGTSNNDGDSRKDGVALAIPELLVHRLGEEREAEPAERAQAGGRGQGACGVRRECVDDVSMCMCRE